MKKLRPGPGSSLALSSPGFPELPPLCSWRLPLWCYKSQAFNTALPTATQHLHVCPRMNPRSLSLAHNVHQGAVTPWNSLSSSSAVCMPKDTEPGDTGSPARLIVTLTVLSSSSPAPGPHAFAPRERKTGRYMSHRLHTALVGIKIWQS